jgi:hypothetical protein
MWSVCIRKLCQPRTEAGGERVTGSNLSLRAFAQVPADLGGNLDRQSDCRYRARTAVRLAAGGKQAMASLTSLPLAGHASIAAALRFHAAAQIAHCERS